MTLPATNHHAPWALIRRNGDTVGKRLSTRMAYLTDTVAGRDGKAVALRGIIMRTDTTGWSKHPRRIERDDVVKTWRRQPSAAEVRAAKRRLPIVTARHASERSGPAEKGGEKSEQHESGRA